MFDKFNINKESIMKVIVALIIACALFLLLSVLTDSKSSRKQITSDTNTEETLCNILNDIKGVGQVSAMISYDDKSKVTGVIVTATGVNDPTVKSNIIKGVSTLFNIEESNVCVYEKKEEVK